MQRAGRILLIAQLVWGISLSASLAQVEPPAVEWEIAMDGGVDSILQTSDDSYLVTGRSWGYLEPGTIRFLKCDHRGAVIWDKAAFGFSPVGFGCFDCAISSIAYASCSRETRDGNYVVAGRNALRILPGGNYLRPEAARGEGGQVTDSRETLLAKMDPTGAFLWHRFFGVGGANGANALEETEDGGFILAGWARANDAGDADIYAVKTDSEGELEWEVTLDGGGDDVGHLVLEAPGGYVIAAIAEPPESPGRRACLLHLDPKGELMWNRIVGSEPIGNVSYLGRVSGGYLVAGIHGGVYVVRTDLDGNTVEDRTFDVGAGSWASSVQPAADGGYVVAGATGVPGAYPDRRPYLLRTDPEGDPVWELTLDADEYSTATWAQETVDGGCVVGVSGGYLLTSSLVKLGTPTAIPGDCNLDGELDISDGICLLGHLFLGEPADLPCGEGTPGDPSNVTLLDSTGDGDVDISDAVRLFQFLFLGGPPPVLGTECRAIPGCPGVCMR
jgi:hypothetical protein